MESKIIIFYMNIIIPLGGKGDRFFKAGFTISKPLIPIYEKEMIFYVLDHMGFHPDDKVFIIYNTHLDHFDFVNIIKKQYPFIHFIPIIYQTSGAVETILLGLKTICENSSIKLPMITYPDCELCACEPIPGEKAGKEIPPDPNDPAQVPPSPLADILVTGSYPLTHVVGVTETIEFSKESNIS
jgi:hypothetical protein